MNIHQKVYQNVLAGNISEEFYKNLQQSGNWTPDTLNFSKTPIKISIAFVYEEDTAGNYRMIIDANNNLDFSDDKVFSPMSTTSNTLFTMLNDSIAKENQIMVAYEEFLNNKIITIKKC